MKPQTGKRKLKPSGIDWIGDVPEGWGDVAVMMWEHQCDRLWMDPEIVKFFLEKAIRGEAPNAAENHEVLRSHIPEVF